MHARITDTGAVAELITHDPAGRYHPSLTWVPVPEALEGWVDHTWRWDAEAEALAPASLDALVSEAAARVAAERWRWQTAGALYDGHRYHTDAEGRQALTGAVVGAQAHEAEHGPGSFSTPWKTADGFTTLDLPGLIAAGQAVLGHVQACFGREAEIVSALQTAAAQPGATAETLIALYDSEIGHGWPLNGES